MQTQTVLISAIREQARWTPESFLVHPVNGKSQAYPLVGLGSLVVERKEGLDPQAYPTHLFNYLGLEHVQSTTGDLVDFNARAGKEIRSRSKVFRQGDVLYGRLRPYLNKVYMAQGRASSGICSGEFYVLIPRKLIVLPRFLRAVLASEFVQRYVTSKQTGTALFRIHIEDLLSMQVPLPPLSVQQAYEAFLEQENTRRRRLAAEAAALPQAMLDAVAEGLTSGEQPHMPTWNAEAVDLEVDICPLPEPMLAVQRSLHEEEDLFADGVVP